MALEQLAYEEAKRAIDRQSTSLDALHGRAGILLAAISLATSFFGGLALSDDDLSGCAIVAVVVALLAFGAAGVACVGVLWPRTKWHFNLSARLIVRQLDATVPDEDAAHRELALRHEANYDVNEERLEGLFRLFRRACFALGVETIAWVVALAV